MYSPILSAVGTYPEREEVRLSRFDKIGVALAARVVPWFRPRAARFEWIVVGVSRESAGMAMLADGEILPFARSLGARMRREGFTEEAASRSFALIREIAHRRLGLRHFDVQLIGGAVLLNGMVAEMETGEGKTLTATLAAGTAALAGIPVHVVTVNDYLAQRDADSMRQVYSALGLSVGTIVQGMTPDERRAAYNCDITYCTNKELTFDYLKDRIVLWDRPGQVRLQLERIYGEGSRVNKTLLRGLQFAIVDEADSVLVDEARTPLIISGESRDLTEQSIYQEAFEAAGILIPDEDFAIHLSDRSVELTGAGRTRVERFPWQERGWTTVRQRQELVRQALVALNLFERDKHYLVRGGKVQIIDEYTGRVMPDRSWEHGLHQLIEIKEACEMTGEKQTRARISYQRFFRRYRRLAGMTGTAREVTGELWATYRLPVVSIPTNRPLRRTYLPDRLFAGEDQKWEAVVECASEMHRMGRPTLIGTRSVAASEKVSTLLHRESLSHRVLNARQDKEEADIVAGAGQPGCITVATNMAGRGTDIKLGPGVAELGGLHVVATERHDAGRIDRQLFGRCARQGDPGSCQAFLSIEDELIGSYGSTGFRHLAALFMKGTGRMGELMGKALFYMAQNRAERVHGRMRRNLLNADEQQADLLAFSGRPE